MIALTSKYNLKFIISCGIISIFATGLLVYTIQQAIASNWLGMTFKPNAKGYGIEIKRIYNSELGNSFSAGDIVVGLQAPDGGIVAVDSETIRPRPSIYVRGSSQRYFAFLQNESRLFQLLKHPRVNVILIDGKVIPARVYQRPFSHIPLNFWLQIGFAVGALILGCRVFYTQHNERAVYHYLTAIIGFYLMACCWALIMNRPLALDGQQYHYLDVISHLGIAMMMSGFLALLWLYPCRLNPAGMPYAIYCFYFLFWVFDALHSFTSLAFAFYSPMFFAFAIATVIGVMQWKSTEKLPADRTVLKWMFFFIYTACSFLLFFVFIPRTLGSFTLVSPNLEFSLLLFIYIGLALAITRYRMVNLELWWSIMWGGYFTLTVVALIYFLLIITISISSALAFSVALFFGVVTFFPFRQWIRSRIRTAPQHELDQYLPTLIELLFSTRSNIALSMQWESILTRIFNPITLTSRKNPVDTVEIADDGVVLRVPDFQPEYAIELAYSNQGRRLFVKDDVRLAQTMYELTRKAISLNDAKVKGAQEERERIVRDLHDDVGAKLITIIHRAGTSQVADLCRSALQDIRDIMSYLGGGSYLVPSMLADWRNEADNRTDAANIRLSWSQTDVIPDIHIDSRTRMNLTRVFRESITNAIKHGQPELIEVGIYYQDGILSFIVKDNGKAKDIESFVKGRGLHNMRDRIKEIDGKVAWSQNKPSGVIVRVDVKIIHEE
jgi:signal transduction histidine kinase